MEVEFGWKVGGGGGVQTHFHVKPNSVEVVLRLSWGCDNIIREIRKSLIRSKLEAEAANKKFLEAMLLLSDTREAWEITNSKIC